MNAFNKEKSTLITGKRINGKHKKHNPEQKGTNRGLHKQEVRDIKDRNAE